MGRHVNSSPLPDNSLLSRYAGEHYTDCFSAMVSRNVLFAEYVEAFYTTAVFKLERSILSGVLSLPSTDREVRELAVGDRDTFAAWRVEDRTNRQLLLCDFRGRTRSWLMLVPNDDRAAVSTRLFFGSAIVKERGSRAGSRDVPPGFKLLLGFHTVYSRVLLSAARARLGRK